MNESLKNFAALKNEQGGLSKSLLSIINWFACASGFADEKMQLELMPQAALDTIIGDGIEQLGRLRRINAFSNPIPDKLNLVSFSEFTFYGGFYD